MGTVPSWHIRDGRVAPDWVEVREKDVCRRLVIRTSKFSATCNRAEVSRQQRRFFRCQRTPCSGPSDLFGQCAYRPTGGCCRSLRRAPRLGQDLETSMPDTHFSCQSVRLITHEGARSFGTSSSKG